MGWMGWFVSPFGDDGREGGADESKGEDEEGEHERP
jgi:hypothetical protein